MTTDDGTRAMAAASDEAAADVDELQFTLGEGPCREAFTSNGPVLIPDLSEDSVRARWPGYAPEALGLGVGAVFAFPLQRGGVRIGVLTVYGGEPVVLSTEQLASASTFADVATTTLLSWQDEVTEDLEAELVDHRSELYQAQGMVMVQLGVGLAEAMARLRAYAYAQGRRLGDVADDVVARRLRLDDRDA